MLFTRWLQAASIRALKTAAQAALGVLGTSLVGILEVDWLNLLSVVLMAAIISLLTSIAGLPEVDGGAPLSEVIADEEAIRSAKHRALLTELKPGVYTDSLPDARAPHLVDEDGDELPDQHLDDYAG